MRYLAAAVVTLNLLWAVSSEAGSISGRVLDLETGNPIWGANIRIIELDTVLESSRQGEFLFENLQDSTYRLVATHVAFDHSDTLLVAVNGVTNFNVTLTPRPWVLEDVVVTGTRSPHLLKNVPVQTEVISKRDFQRTGATTVDEALTSSIGVAINDDLSGKGATIRGVQGDRILVLVDGERAVGRVNGAIDLGQLSLSNVEKIEVVKGTGSTLYGSDAMGGVINVITRKISNNSNRLNLRSEAGAYATFNPDLQFEYSNYGWGANLGAKYYHTDGFDLDKSTPHTNGLDEIDRINFDGKLKVKLSEGWGVTGSTRLMFEDRKWIESEIWPGNLLFIYDDDESNNRYDGSLQFDYLSGDQYSMNLRFYGSYYDHQWNKIERENDVWLDTSKTEDVFLEASYSSNYVIGQNHVATYGFDYNQSGFEVERAVSGEGSRRGGRRLSAVRIQSAPEMDLSAGRPLRTSQLVWRQNQPVDQHHVFAERRDQAARLHRLRFPGAVDQAAVFYIRSRFRRLRRIRRAGGPSAGSRSGRRHFRGTER